MTMNVKRVITTDDQNIQEFNALNADLRAEKTALQQARAATEAARLALPTQVQTIMGPAVQAAQSAANLAAQRAGVMGSVPNDAALAGRAAGDYRIGTEIVSWNGAAITSRTGVLANAAQLPRQTTLLAHGALGQASWDASTAQAVADLGSGGVLHLPQTGVGDATYVYDGVPDFSTVTVSADPNVTVSVPSLNGVSLSDWRLLTPLRVHVRDRQHDVVQAPTATGLDWLGQLAQGSLWHDIGLIRPQPLDGTTLSAVRRYTNRNDRDAGQITRLPNGLTWWSGQSGGGIDAAVMTDPAPGTHASACMETGFAPVGRVGVLIEAGVDYLYLSTDATNVYTGLYSAGAGWVETSKSLPSAAYSAVGTGMPEYAWRIVSDREAEVYINGVEVGRFRFTGAITAAGWGVFFTTLGGPGEGSGYNAYARDLVIGTSERAHLGRPVVVGIYSDSVGFGEGLNIGWADAVESALRGEAGISRVTVINRAVSGANSTQQRQRLDADGAVGQTVTVISVGINDQQQFTDPAAYRDNLVAMVLRVRTDGSIPVLVVPHTYLDKRNPNYGFASSNYAQAGRYHAVVRRVAAELGVICADAAAAVGVVSPDTVYTVTRDNLHPTVQAAVQIGREVARAVMQALTTRVTASTVATAPAPTPATFSGALVTASAASVAQGADYPTWTESYDVGGWFDPAQPTRLTVPARVTRVRLSGYVRFAGSAGGGIRSVGVFKNGRHNTGGLRVDGVSDITFPSNGADTPVGVPLSSGVIPVTPGDWFELYTYQNSGSTLSLDDGQDSYFSIEAVP